MLSTKGRDRDSPEDYRPPSESSPPGPLGAAGRRGIHPYSMLKLLDRPEHTAIPLPPGRWTPVAVAELTNEQILSQIEALGLTVSHDSFLRQVAGRVSAWEVGMEWVAQGPDLAQEFDEDFLLLAACELWKRWCPQAPFVEMLDDWIEEGYRLIHEKQQSVAGCELWLSVWGHLRPHIRAVMTQCADFDEVFMGTQCLFNWTQDLALELEAGVRVEARLAIQGLAYLQGILKQFTAEDYNYRVIFQESIGRLHLQIGQIEQAENVFQQILEENPQSARGYVLLADAWAFHSQTTSAENRGRVADILRQALNYPVNDAADFDVVVRLNDLRTTE